MQPGLPSFANLAKGLAVLSQQRATGELILSSADNQWHLYLFLGRLIYATRETHRVRRWYRAVKQDCPNWKFEEHNLKLKRGELWEYHLLKWGIEQNQITLTQVKNVVSTIIDEVLFDLVGYSKLNSSWLTKKLHPITLIDAKPCLHTAVELRNRWRNMGCGQMNLDTAPIVKQPNFENFRVSKSFYGIIQLVNGENTIWDIASQLKENVITVSSHIQQLLNQGILELVEVADIPTPGKIPNSKPLEKQGFQFFTSIEDTKQIIQSQSIPLTNTSTHSSQQLRKLGKEGAYSSHNHQLKLAFGSPIESIPVTAIPEKNLYGNLAVTTDRIPASEPEDRDASSSNKATYNRQPDISPPSTSPIQPEPTKSLIAYIDDSHSDGLKMESILTQAGYGCINVQEPVKALSTILEHKPSLIFLDLIMPIANGYEICAQIRRVSALKNTPVIILTSNDGIIDRVRARMVGSSGFLAKPITTDKVIKILQKYLPNSVSAELQKQQFLPF
ncbi:hypothetical protein NUACC21_19510 [Scytonema sp. NUACC21]